MATTRREIQEQEPVVEDVPIYTEEEQLAPEEFINPFGPDEFNYRRALSDGYNLSEINQFLAAEQGFDIEQAYRDGYNDEEIVEFLSGGKIARSAAPILRGAAEGAVEEGLGAYGLVKGATSGFKTGLKFPGPPRKVNCRRNWCRWWRTYIRDCGPKFRRVVDRLVYGR